MVYTWEGGQSSLAPHLTVPGFEVLDSKEIGLSAGWPMG